MTITRSTFEQQLDDYLNDQLAPEARRAMETWLADHPEDQELLNQARVLRERVADLPRDVVPDRDLWPSIRAQLTERNPRATAPAPAFRFPRWLAAAASVVLLVGAAWVTLQFKGDDPATVATALPPATPVNQDTIAPADGALQQASLDADPSSFDAKLEQAEQQFIDATAQLMEVLEQRRASLPPDKLQFVESNLKTINEAIEDVRSALRSEPGNPVHGQALAAMYHQKVELLLLASRLPEES